MKGTRINGKKRKQKKKATAEDEKVFLTILHHETMSAPSRTWETIPWIKPPLTNLLKSNSAASALGLSGVVFLASSPPLNDQGY